MTRDFLSDMALYARIVECGSLSAAGRQLDLPKATVSRRLRLLEQRLGAPLLRRSTRALTPTDFGLRYFQRIQPIVREALLAQTEAESEHSEPSGLIRLSAPVSFGHEVLAPIMFKFLAGHPSVRLDLRLSDERVPIVAGGVDIAIRMGQLADSELVSRRLGKIQMKLVASPQYIAEHGQPTNPEAINKHKAVLTRLDLDHWTIEDQVVRPTWQLSTSSMLVTREALRQGLGMGLLPAFLAEADIKSGLLVELLPNHPFPSNDVNALWPRSQTPSLAVSTLVTYLIEELRY